MNFLQDIDFSQTKVKICVSLVSLLIIILAIIGFNKFFIKDNNEVVEEQQEIVSTEPVVQEVTYKEVEIMRVIQQNNVYSVIKKQANKNISTPIYYITLNDSYYGESSFNNSSELYDLMVFDGIIMESTSNKSNSGNSIANDTSIESESEESLEDNLNSEINLDNQELQFSVDFTTIADKMISDELVYKIDRVTATNFVNTLLNKGYEIHTQIATNIYNELFLLNTTENHCYRVIILLGQDLMIISEIDNLSSLDIDKIIQKIS